MRIALLFFVLLYGCGCGSSKGGGIRIGIDASWYPLNFGRQQPFVNGFVEDLLLDIARYQGIEFERIDAVGKSLDELKNCDAILTSLPPYPFNEAKYEFSQNFLDLGPVLIVSVDAPEKELSQMTGALVGLVEGDADPVVLQKYPDLILRHYPTIPDLLDALVEEEIEGALLSRIPAVSYLSDLYVGRLKIASLPLTDTGLHLIAPKGRQKQVVEMFDRNISRMKKRKQLHSLLQKWNLEPS